MQFQQQMMFQHMSSQLQQTSQPQMNMMMMQMMMQRPLTAPMGHVGHTENWETVVESLGKRQKRSSTSELAGNLTSELARSVHGVGRSGHEPQSSSDRDGATMDHDYYGQSVSECVLQNSIVPNSSNSLSGCWRIYFGSASSQISWPLCAPNHCTFHV